jgi:DnaJ homolog subfamily C member 8
VSALPSIPLSYAEIPELLTLVECRIVIHPDKTPHVNAPDAFDLLKKARPLFLLKLTGFFIPLTSAHATQAESELSDAPKRADLDAVIMEARILLLREFNPPLPSSTPDSDPALKALGKQWKAMLRAKSRDMLIEEEVRRRK